MPNVQLASIFPGDAHRTESYLIPGGDLSLADRTEARVAVDNQLIDIGARDFPSAQKWSIRDTEPHADINFATTGDWLDAAAGVAGTAHAYINHALPNKTYMGFFGVNYLSAPANVSWLKFFIGLSQTAVIAFFHLEQIQQRLERFGYFSQMIVYNSQDTVYQTVMPKLAYAANIERIVMLSRIAEPEGNTILAPVAA